MSFDVRVTPDAWTPRGEARVRSVRDRPDLHVFGGIPGEEATVWVHHQGQNQAVGLFRGTDDPHPHRVVPPCDRYNPCGGCPLMHLDGPGQWDAREALVRDALAAHGLEGVVIARRHDSPSGLEDFRHVVKVGAGYSDQGSIRLGAWGRRNRSIVPIPRCNVATPTLRRGMSALAHHVIDHEIRPYDPERERGILRSAVLRQSRTTGEVLITLVAARRIRPLQDLAEAVANDLTETAGVWVHVNKDPGNAIFQRDEDGAVGVSALVGKAWIEETLNGISYRIGPGDFFQTHPAMAEVLYQRTLERLELREGATFVDLYCGVGGLALQGSRATGWALGIEEVEGAVARARESAHRNGLTAEFLCGRVGELLPDVRRRLGERRPVVTVNPARRGLEEGVIDGIAALRPRRVAYVSCNPRVLARDLARFRELGFEVGALELFDMFPNTPHVEVLAVLTGQDPDAPARRAPRRRVVRR